MLHSHPAQCWCAMASHDVWSRTVETCSSEGGGCAGGVSLMTYFDDDDDDGVCVDWAVQDLLRKLIVKFRGDDVQVTSLFQLQPEAADLCCRAFLRCTVSTRPVACDWSHEALIVCTASDQVRMVVLAPCIDAYRGRVQVYRSRCWLMM